MTENAVLFLCSWYPNLKAPTLGNFVQRHAKAISKNRKVVVLFATSIENQKEDFRLAKSFSENLSEFIVYYRKPKFKFSQIIWIFKALQFGLNEIEKKYSIDFVHLNVIRPLGFFAFYLKKFKNLPYVITEHWTGFLPSNNYFEKLSFFEKALIRIVGKNADAIFPVSQDLGKNMGLKGIANHYFPIPNVVNEALFFPKDEMDEFFLHVSHLKQSHKNIFGIIEAFNDVVKSYPSAKLIIVGDEEKQHVIDFINSKNLQSNIELIGPLDGEAIANLMQKALAFILFSNYENLPCVLEEAQMSGCRIISTDVGGILEFFKSDGINNIIIKPNDIAALSLAMKSFILPDSYENKLKRAQEAKSLFSVEAISFACNSAYKALKLIDV